MTKVNPKQWNRNKIRHFSVGHIQILLKYFDDFYSWTFHPHCKSEHN